MSRESGRSKDPRTRTYVNPVRVVWTTEDELSTVENVEVLLIGRDGQSTLRADDPCVLRNGGSPPGFLIDFGMELHGGIQISIWEGSSPTRTVKMRVRFGESAMEAMSDIGGGLNATNDHAVRDGVIDVSLLGTTEFGNTGFRFARIDFMNEDSYVELNSVRAVLLYHDIEYKGSFRSSDPILDQIWQTGAYTVHLNMQDYLWDGIKRDRLVWTGDMHPETSTLQAVFGYHDVVPMSLDFIRDRSPLPKWMALPTYSIWWVLIHHDWYMHNGDLPYLLEQKEYMSGLVQLLMDQVKEDGSIEIPLPFLDWPSSANPQGVKAGVHALFIWSMSTCAKLFRIMGEEQTAVLCDSYERKLRVFLPDHNGSKQAAALLALMNMMDPVVVNNEIIAPDAPKGYSTFYGYYILKARAEAGDVKGSLDSIRAYWGGMLSLGATTFWEDFDMDWLNNAARIDELTPEGKVDVHGSYGGYCYLGYRHSLCHGWASGPTAWLSEYVLGIHIIEPGCKTIQVRPLLGDLDWVEGTYPTPLGNVWVRHIKQADGSIHSAITAPDGVTILN